MNVRVLSATQSQPKPGSSQSTQGQVKSGASSPHQSSSVPSSSRPSAVKVTQHNPGGISHRLLAARLGYPAKSTVEATAKASIGPPLRDDADLIPNPTGAPALISSAMSNPRRHGPAPTPSSLRISAAFVFESAHNFQRASSSPTRLSLRLPSKSFAF